MALCMAALALGGCASPAGPEDVARGRRIRRPPGIAGEQPDGRSPDAAAGGLDIRMNFEVVDTFLDFLQRREVTDGELRRWVHLQGNRELLRQGRMDGDLTAAVLKEAVRAAVRGEPVPGPGPAGRIAAGPWDVLRSLVASIKEREQRLAARASKTLAPYLPAGRTLPPLSIYFHLGGAGDGRTSDNVYINLSFFQSRGMGSLAGLDALLAHELFHMVQAVVLGSVEDYSSRHSALFSLLLRIQQEGIARLIEYRYLKSHFPEFDLDRTNAGKYEDGLRHAAEVTEQLAGILATISEGRLGRARVLTEQGFALGGSFYAYGHALAQEVETVLGTGALAATVDGGPVPFFEAYVEAQRRGGQPSLLPPGLEADLASLKTGYGAHWMEATRRRRDGLRLIRDGRLEEAVAVLKSAIRLDPTDAASAYNTACAYALGGMTKRALKWIEKAFRKGYHDYKHVMVDPDLFSLHEEPEFGRMLRSRGVNFPDPAKSGAGHGPISP